MNTFKELLQKLKDETETILNAVNAKALDEVIYLIDQRELLIGEIESLNEYPMDKADRALYEAFNVLEKEVESKLQHWMKEETKAFNQLKTEKRQLGHNRKAFGQYAQSTVYTSQGHNLDQKK